MRFIFSICFAIVVFLMAFRTFSELTINGFVRDQQGQPLANVIVTEGQNHKGTRTALDGSFSLSVSSKHPNLIFRLKGYDLQKYQVKDYANSINISMKVSGKQLDEVVVLGYGLQRRKDVSGSATADIRGSNSPYPSPVAMEKESMQTDNTGLDDRHHCRGMADSSAFNTEEYDAIIENRFLTATENPLSTFSIDVDGSAYSNIRRYLEMGQMPPSGAVRIEELINYFHYEYPQPLGNQPFSINTELGDCAWNPTHKLVMIGLQGKKIPVENLPSSNLVFLIDVSGSMMEPLKLPLVQRSLKMLVDQLREQDRVSLVVYAGNAGLVMPSTSGGEKIKIKDAIDRLEAGGSTAGGAGIQLAYEVAAQNFVKNGNNRVILCTDGDFNVGPSSDSDLEGLIEKEKKTGVFLTVLGFGMGNYKDSKMEKLADRGNGNHAYIDNENEARKVLVNEFGGTLFTIAKDVKLQIEFNPAKVQAYRLIGYENRMLNKEDFNNDAKDAGELGSGHTVTALYEIIPAGVKNDFLETVDSLRYQNRFKPPTGTAGNELLTIKFRYKKPDAEISQLIEHSVTDREPETRGASINFRFVTSVAEFGMLLRNSEFRQACSYDKAYSIAKGALGEDSEGYRAEFLKLVQRAGTIAKNGQSIGEDDVSGIK